MSHRPRYYLILEPMPHRYGDPLPERRLARLLKYAGRACRLRCIAIGPHKDETLGPAPPQAKPRKLPRHEF
jgi:hypothetical protein